MLAQEYVNFISSNAVPQEYHEANQAELHLFKHIKDDLTVNNGAIVLLKGSQIVVPMQLREKAVSIAHEGHQGIVRNVIDKVKSVCNFFLNRKNVMIY